MLSVYFTCLFKSRLHLKQCWSRSSNHIHQKRLERKKKEGKVNLFEHVPSSRSQRQKNLFWPYLLLRKIQAKQTEAKSYYKLYATNVFYYYYHKTSTKLIIKSGLQDCLLCFYFSYKKSCKNEAIIWSTFVPSHCCSTYFFPAMPISNFSKHKTLWKKKVWICFNFWRIIINFNFVQVWKK